MSVVSEKVVEGLKFVLLQLPGVRVLDREDERAEVLVDEAAISFLNISIQACIHSECALNSRDLPPRELFSQDPSEIVHS